MKKIFISMLAVCVMIISAIGLTACGDEPQEDMFAKYKIDESTWDNTYDMNTYKNSNDYWLTFDHSISGVREEDGQLVNYTMGVYDYSLKVKDGKYMIEYQDSNEVQMCGYDGTSYYYSTQSTFFDENTKTNDVEKQISLNTIFMSKANNDGNLIKVKLAYFMPDMKNTFSKFEFDSVTPGEHNYLAKDSEAMDLMTKITGSNVANAENISIRATYEENKFIHLKCEYTIGEITHLWVFSVCDILDFYD